MRVLLDECLPRRLKNDLSAHDVRTVPEMGWAGKRNGELLDLAKGEFETFVTMDRNLQYQQNLADHSLFVIVLQCKSNRYEDLVLLVPGLIDRLRGDAPAGKVFRINDKPLR